MSAANTPLGRVAEYRRLALLAHALIDTSVLANVREKHELAAARWNRLADLAERTNAEHLSRVSMARADPTPKLA